MTSNKGTKFLETIDDGIKTLLNFDTDDMVPHFIYCTGDSYYRYADFYYSYDEYLEKLILSRMKENGIQSTIFTTLWMERQNLITKEKSKAAYEGKLKNEDAWEKYEVSINDDLESFSENLQEISSLEEVQEEDVWSFFLPKLTKEEMKLVEEKDRKHMMTYYYGLDADVDKKEMKKSDSKDKYVHGWCSRWTRVLNFDVNLSETSSESSSSIASESESLIETPAIKKRRHDL